MLSTQLAHRSTAQGQVRPPYLAAAGAFAVILALYVATIAPTTQFWDTSEYIAAAKVLGIPHPPGNPLFVLIASVWGMLPLAAHYALRINLLAATTTAAAAGFLFLVAERMLASATALPRWLRLLTAGAGTLVGAASFTVWNQATVNEKTYTISLLSITLVMWLAVRWADAVGRADRRFDGSTDGRAGGSAGRESFEPSIRRTAEPPIRQTADPPIRRSADPPATDRYLVLIAYLLMLTTGNHLMGLLGAPLVAVYLLWTEPRALARWQLWAAIGVALLVAASVWVYLPIRAPHFPPINEGEPTTWAALKAVLLREQYQKPPLTVRQADFLSQMGNYFQYFSWQYARDWSAAARAFFAVIFAGLGLAGAWRQLRRDRRAGIAMLALMVTITVVLVYYLNFKYGFSYRPADNLEREVRERDYFFVASFLLWGIWIAIGLGTLLETLAAWLSPRGGNQPTADAARGWRVAAPALAISLIPVAGNRISASRVGETVPRDFAIDLLQSVEPYAILITTGDNDTFPLWYAQEVEGVRRDVIIANQSLMRTDWHLRQINRRPTFPFDSSNAALPYRGTSWPPPANRPFSLTDPQLDALPEVYPLSRPAEFRVDSVVLQLQPRTLLRDDLATFQLIRDNLGKRPIYFSRTTGGYPDDIGFTPYLVTQGLARKLEPRPVRTSPGLVFDRRLGWVDLERTRELLFEVYHSQSASRRRPLGWIDRPSEGMLVVYGLVYAVYADLARVPQGEWPASPELAARADSLAAAIFANTSFGAAAFR